MEPLTLSSGVLQSPAPSTNHHHHHHHAHHMLHPAWGFPPGPGSLAPGQPPAELSGNSSGGGDGIYEASVVATSLLPPGDAWSHHPMLATPAPAPHHWTKEDEQAHAAGGGEAGPHDDSGISPGRTSSSGGPSSSGGSPPAAGGGRSETADHPAPSPPHLVKMEPQDAEEDCRSSPVTHEDDSSDMSEDTMDSLSRLQMALSQSGSPLGDIYNSGAPAAATESEQSVPAAIQCPLCPHVAATLPSLASHLSSHVEHHKAGSSGEAPSDLQCLVCSFVTLVPEEFMAHLSCHYSGSELPAVRKSHSVRRCSVCDFATKSASKLKAHLAEFHGFAPGENEMEMIEEEEDANTPQVNSQGKVKTFRCKQCNFVAVTKLDFWSHSRSHIKSEKMLSCPRCPFVTEYKHHLEYHLRNHSGSKPFKCSQCSYTCVNKSMLNSHSKSHSNVYQYRCVDCNYATKYCHSLKLHLRKYSHSPAMVLNPDGSPNPLPIIDVYGTRRGPKAKKENQVQESQNNVINPNEEKPQDIFYPNTTPISQLSYLVNPPPVPAFTEDPYKCAQCDFSTACQETFAQHLLTGHSSNNRSKSRSPPISIPKPEKVIHPPPPIMIPQQNQMKEYLAWVYSRQQHALDLYQKFKGSVALPEPNMNFTAATANPLDLSKEVRKPDSFTNNNINRNNNNNTLSSTKTSTTNKNRRKGKAFKLERIAVIQQEDIDDDLKPPPSKIRNNGTTQLNGKKEYFTPATPPTPLQMTPQPPQQLTSSQSHPSPQSPPSRAQHNGVAAHTSTPAKALSTDEDKAKSAISPAVLGSKAPPSPVAVAPADTQPTYNCSYCDILFRDVVMYTMHMGYHGYKDPFHCNMCGQQTADKLSFFLHIARSSHN